MILEVVGGSFLVAANNINSLLIIGGLFCGIQPIISFCLAMMKSNVRKYTMSVLTLSYIRKAPESTPTAVDGELEIAC